jgi:hypothetical protein
MITLKTLLDWCQLKSSPDKIETASFARRAACLPDRQACLTGRQACLASVCQEGLCGWAPLHSAQINLPLILPIAPQIAYLCNPEMIIQITRIP